MFVQDPVIIDFKPPLIGRPAAQLPYRATHPLDDNIPSDGVLRAHDCVADSGGMHQQLQNEHQEEPQYVTPLPADDMFEGVDAEMMRDVERFGRFRGSNEMAPLDDDGDDDGNESGGDEEDEDEDDDAANIAEVDDEVNDDDDDDDDDDEQRRSCRVRSFCRVTSDMGIGRAEQVRRQTMFVHSVDCKG